MLMFWEIIWIKKATGKHMACHVHIQGAICRKNTRNMHTNIPKIRLGLSKHLQCDVIEPSTDL